MLARAHGFTVLGIEGLPVQIEVDINGGSPDYTTVGLPDAAVRESRERVVAAMRNSGFDFPEERVTVNLAPAELKKEGASLDLGIALSILAASRHRDLKPLLETIGVAGELALDGRLRRISGALSMAIQAVEDGLSAIILPTDNAIEASSVGIPVLAADSLREVVEHLTGRVALVPLVPPAEEPALPDGSADLADVRGQAFAKRALEVAAAGGHNLVFIGPPGTGKSMLARRLAGILPPISRQEAVETTRIHSVARLLGPREGLIRERPFRAPHHTVSDVALVGGGHQPRPGEISLAHNGVLFLDELPEFHRDVLEALRQPLESGRMLVARASGSVAFPARFQFIAAMNPCPCGYSGHPSRACLCSPLQARKYRAKVSGPLWDRIDLHVEMAPITFSEFSDESLPAPEGSASVRERVLRARQKQETRFAGSRTAFNARMTPKQVRAHCRLDEAGHALLEKAMDRFGFSARSLDRLLRVARTLADMEGAERIAREHLVEAVQYRSLDRGTSK